MRRLYLYSRQKYLTIGMKNKASWHEFAD